MSALRHALPWTTVAGRFSLLKLAVFLAALAPGLWLGLEAGLGLLGAEPVLEAQHQAGDWAIRLLLVTLALTPLRRILAAPRLAMVRRMLGLSVLAYALLHGALYLVEQDFRLSQVAREITHRPHLAVGFLALSGLLILGATSHRAAMQQLGRAWGRLHRGVYAIAVLAGLHYFLQAKADVSPAVLAGGLLLLLFAYRAGFALGLPMQRPLLLSAFALLGGVLTAAIEYSWYALATAIPAERVLAANLAFPAMIRPAWWVFAAGLALALLRCGAQRSAAYPGSGMGSASPGTVGKRPARQSILAAAIRSRLELTKSHSMKRGPSITAPPGSSTRDGASALSVIASPARNTRRRPSANASPATSSAPAAMQAARSSASGSGRLAPTASVASTQTVGQGAATGLVAP